MKRLSHCLLLAVLVTAVGRSGFASTIISTGFDVPETISQAPASFGAFGGTFFIPDAGTTQIMVMPALGGPPSVFQTVAGQNIRGGIFLPSGFGSTAGQYIVLGRS